MYFGFYAELQWSYLCLDAVQTSEPEDLSSPQLHLSMVNLICALCQLLLVDLLLCNSMTCLLQELQVVRRDGRDQLIVRENIDQSTQKLTAQVNMFIRLLQVGS